VYEAMLRCCTGWEFVFCGGYLVLLVMFSDWKFNGFFTENLLGKCLQLDFVISLSIDHQSQLL
jgi:hypothetical protein